MRCDGSRAVAASVPSLVAPGCVPTRPAPSPPACDTAPVPAVMAGTGAVSASTVRRGARSAGRQGIS